MVSRVERKGDRPSAHSDSKDSFWSLRAVLDTYLDRSYQEVKYNVSVGPVPQIPLYPPVLHHDIYCIVYASLWRHQSES
jgi:hypothetical protein